MRQLEHVSPGFACLTSPARTASRARAVAFTVSALALLAAAGACGHGTITEGVTDSAFVATMAELERIERTPGLDSAARVAARTAALQRQGLSRQQVEDAAAALADEPDRALAIFRAIQAKSDGTDTIGANRPPGSPPLPATSTASPAIRRR